MAGFIKCARLGLILLAVAVVPPTMAQQSEDRSLAEQTDPHALLQEIEQVQQRLLQIQERAMTGSPELQEQAEELQMVLLEAMRERDFEPEASLARLEQLERQLQTESMDETQRNALSNALREEQRKLIAAEQEAMESEQVSEVSERFTQNLLQAMRELDSETDELLGQLKQKHAQLQEIITARVEE